MLSAATAGHTEPRAPDLRYVALIVALFAWIAAMSDPPQLVRFGEQTTNEMCFGFLQASGDHPGPVRWYLDEDRKILMPPRRGPLAPPRPASGPAGK